MKLNFTRRFWYFACAVPLLLVVCMPALQAQTSLNVTMLSNWHDSNLPTNTGFRYNDVWGYAANGREYAILGTMAGFNIIDVTVATSPNLVGFYAGGSSSSIWRDFKTYQNYLYCVSDQGSASSLQVYDLSTLPAGATKVFDSQAFGALIHNVTVEEGSGRLYLSGSDAQTVGVVILDIGTNPAAPTQLASFFLGSYTHDVFVKNDTLYAFMGNNGITSFDLVNLAYPSGIDQIFSYAEAGYAHSGAATEDFQYLYWLDETHDTGIHIGDISDPTNITVTGTFRSALLAPTHINSIGHNPFIKDSILYVAYYHDGLQMWDIRNPVAPVRIGFYDTYPSNTDYTSAVGAWGVYPYLPSGNLLVSDTETGLYVLQANATFPVNLTDFEAVALPDRVRLNWTTHSESNNESFTVERSFDGQNFADIRTIGGAGNSQNEIQYETYDEQPLEGLAYYRLRQTDFEGERSFSEVRQVDFGNNFDVLSVFPSPARRGTTAQIRMRLRERDNVQVRVADMNGRLVWTKTLKLEAGTQEIDLPTASWAAGNYMVKVAGKNAVSAHKLSIIE